MPYLYRHIRLDTNTPFYVGIGIKAYRAYEKSKRNIHWQRIVKNTGYKVQILFSDLSWKEACEKEKEFIKLYGRQDLGTGSLCNQTIGGDGIVGLVRSSDHKEKLRQANLGKKMSIESIQKLREAATGRLHSKETKLKMSISRTGKSLSEEHRKQISKGNIGKIFTETHKSKIRQTRVCHPVLQYDLDGNFIKEWKSKHEAARCVGIARMGIYRCLNNICQQAGGFIWKIKNVNVIEC